MKSTLILGISFAAVALMATLGAGRAEGAGVTVHRETFRGWPGSLRISNGIVEAVVVPQIGRIMLFQWVGQPDSDAIFVNSALAGKTGADFDSGTWANFGGDKLWPAPQSDWPRHTGSGWPPDRAFDGDPFQAEIVQDGVRLTGPWSKGFGARAVRTITMRPGEARLYIAQELERNGEASASALPVGIWNITQTRGDATIFLPLGQGARGDAGYHMLPAQTDRLTPGWSVVDGLLVGTRDPKLNMKVGSTAGAGWMGSLYAGDILFSEHYTYHPGGSYPDSGSTTEIYTNGGDLSYIEMEIMAPLVPLGADETSRFDVSWELTRLPHAPRDQADAARVVRAAMEASRR